MSKTKRIRPKNHYLEVDELMIALTSIVGLLTVAQSENRDSRIADANTITNKLIKRLRDAPRPVIIVLDGMIQNVIGLDNFHILDFDSLSDMTCPFCLERDLPLPHEERWLCPHCGTDLNGYQYDNASQAHKRAPMIVNHIRAKWTSTRYVHGAPGEAKTK